MSEHPFSTAGLFNMVVSRRTLLSQLPVAGAAVAGIALVPGFAAAQASPAASPAAVPQLLQTWAAALSSHDATQAVALFTSDGMLEDLAFGLHWTGTSQLQAGFAGFFKAVPDYQVRVTTGFVAGTLAAAEWVQSGTDHGLCGPGQPATGKRFQTRGASIFALQGGKIRRESDYYNLVTILQQLGLISGGATPVATPAS